MARTFAQILKADQNPITTPGIYNYGPPGKRRARTYSQVIADSTRGIEAGMANPPGKVGPNGPAVDQRQAPDWRGHYLGKRAVPLANCEAGSKFIKAAGFNEDLGLVFGWAIVSKEDGQPYYDLNIDWEGEYAGQRVPEHIPEATMLKGALDFALTPDRPGNEMHAGPETGSFPFVWPLTDEIAKAMGISCKRTGLMVGYYPEASVLAKFKSGEYTGFSIEGFRGDSTEHE